MLATKCSNGDGVIPEPYPKDPYRRIEYHCREKDVDSLMRVFDVHIWTDPRLGSRFHAHLDSFSKAVELIATHGTVEQLDAFLGHVPSIVSASVEFVFPDIIIAVGEHGNHNTAFRYLINSKFLTETTWLLYQCLCNDWEVDWRFKDFTWSMTEGEKEFLAGPVSLFKFFDAPYTLYLKYFDAIDAHAPADLEDLTEVYRPIIQRCLHMIERIMEPHNIGVLLLRHILEERAFSAEVFAQNSECGHTLLHYAAETRDVHRITLILEFVDSTSRFKRTSQYGFAPLDLYTKAENRFDGRYNKEIIALLSPPPTKGAHE